MKDVLHKVKCKNSTLNYELKKNILRSYYIPMKN